MNVKRVWGVCISYSIGLLSGLFGSVPVEIIINRIAFTVFFVLFLTTFARKYIEKQ